MRDPVTAFVGRRIRRRRRLLNMTQQELGAACGVTFQQVQKYESASSRIAADTLWKLAQAMDVDVAYFFEGFAETSEQPEAPSARRLRA